MNSLWFFEDVNLFNILCPHKFKGYKGGHAFNEYRKNDYIYFEDAAADKVITMNAGITLGSRTSFHVILSNENLNLTGLGSVSFNIITIITASPAEIAEIKNKLFIPKVFFIGEPKA